MQLNARGRTPGSVWEPRNEDAGPGGTRDLEAGPERGEDGQADRLGDDLGRDRDDDAVLGLFSSGIDDSVGRLGGVGIGRGGERRPSRIGINSFF